MCSGCANRKGVDEAGRKKARDGAVLSVSGGAVMLLIFNRIHAFPSGSGLLVCAAVFGLVKAVLALVSWSRFRYVGVLAPSLGGLVTNLAVLAVTAVTPASRPF